MVCLVEPCVFVGTYSYNFSKLFFIENVLFPKIKTNHALFNQLNSDPVGFGRSLVLITLWLLQCIQN